MHVTSNEKISRLVVACWILVFPGHFIYQTIVQLGLIRPLLGGYFTASIVAVLIFLMPYLLLNFQTHRSKISGRLSKIFWLYVAIFFLTVVVGSMRGADPEIVNPLFAYIIKFIGLYVLAVLTPWENRKFIKILGYFHFALFVFIVFNSSEGVYLVNHLNDFDENFQFDYQGVALSFSVLSLAAGYSTKSFLVRWFQWIFALGGLFLIGARSEFVGVIFAIALVELMREKIRAEIIALVGLLIVFIVISVVVLFSVDLDGRMFGLLNFSEDQSVMERREINASAWATIVEYPIFGDFASYTPGGYGHNILSAWVDMGVIGFVLLLILLGVPMIHIILFRIRGCTGAYDLAFAYLGMCLLMLMFAKSYFYQLIPIAVGAYSRVVAQSRFLNNTK